MRALDLQNGKISVENHTNHRVLGSETEFLTKDSVYSKVLTFPLDFGDGESFIPKVVVRSSDVGTFGRVRLLDVTNGAVLSESAIFSNTARQVITLPSATPATGQTVVELQIKRDSGLNKEVYCEGLLLEYP